MFIKKIVLPSVAALLLASSFNIFAEAPCSSGSVAACWQICNINDVDHMVCARSISKRMNDCKKRNGKIQPAISRCGFGFNCSGCQD